MRKLIDLIFKLLKIDNSLLFIGSTDILPPPLSKEEELEEIIKSKKGDIVARNKLIEHNLRLVVFLAKKIWEYRIWFRRSSIYWIYWVNKRNWNL